MRCLNANICVHPVGTKIIVPGANGLRSFVYMYDCMNNVRNEFYEVSCVFCDNVVSRGGGRVVA
jgi:hypothetical protein